VRGREEVSKRRDNVGVCCPTSDPDAAAAREARLEALMAQKSATSANTATCEQVQYPM
jgi:hypothetical protein